MIIEVCKKWDVICRHLNKTNSFNTSPHLIIFLILNVPVFSLTNVLLVYCLYG